VEPQKQCVDLSTVKKTLVDSFIKEGCQKGHMPWYSRQMCRVHRATKRAWCKATIRPSGCQTQH